MVYPWSKKKEENTSDVKEQDDSDVKEVDDKQNSEEEIQNAIMVKLG